jgi:replicative DNA helicase
VKTKQLKNSTRTLELGEISRQCKEMAKELNVPVIVLAQLNRDIEKGGEREPRLSDLRDSGEIEQDADIVAFVQKDKQDGISRLIVAKHRHARIGECSLLARLDISRFESMPNGYNHEQKPAQGISRYV